jgi:hypothetical protein
MNGESRIVGFAKVAHGGEMMADIDELFTVEPDNRWTLN